MSQLSSELRLGFVDLDFECSTQSTVWAEGNLAEAPGQLGKMVEHRRNQSQPNPGLSSLGTPCIGTVFDFLWVVGNLTKVA